MGRLRKQKKGREQNKDGWKQEKWMKEEKQNFNEEWKEANYEDVNMRKGVRNRRKGRNQR